MTTASTSGSEASIAAIDAASLEARRLGHELAGFRRLCSSDGYQFCARCRGCGREVTVHRDSGQWWHSPISPCERTERGHNGDR